MEFWVSGKKSTFLHGNIKSRLLQKCQLLMLSVWSWAWSWIIAKPHCACWRYLCAKTGCCPDGLLKMAPWLARATLATSISVGDWLWCCFNKLTADSAIRSADQTQRPGFPELQITGHSCPLPTCKEDLSGTGNYRVLDCNGLQALLPFFWGGRNCSWL